MRGIVLDFDEKAGKGLIAGDDKERYEFERKSWRSGGSVNQNAEVDFEVKDGQAVSVYQVSAEDNQKEFDEKINHFFWKYCAGGIILGFIYGAYLIFK